MVAAYGADVLGVGSSHVMNDPAWWRSFGYIIGTQETARNASRRAPAAGLLLLGRSRHFALPLDISFPVCSRWVGSLGTLPEPSSSTSAPYGEPAPSPQQSMAMFGLAPRDNYCSHAVRGRRKTIVTEPKRFPTPSDPLEDSPAKRGQLCSLWSRAVMAKSSRRLVVADWERHSAAPFDGA